MKKLTFEEAVELIKKHQTVPKWIQDARTAAQELRALIDGDKFSELLINKIEKIESSSRAAARKKYVRDIRSLFERILSKRSNVFESSGGSEEVKITSEAQRQAFIDRMNNFKGNKSVKQYLSEVYLDLWDKDPNGLLFLEYKANDAGDGFKLYPTYKATKDLRFYQAEGQSVDVVVFEPIPDKDNSGAKLWRLVDAYQDWCIRQNGESYTDVTEGPHRTFEHPFGYVPAVVLSPHQVVGEELRLSGIHPVVEDAKDYCQLKSMETIYTYQKAAPIHWRLKAKNRVDTGLNKTGNGDSQTSDPQGLTETADVTDIVTLPIPGPNDPKIAPDIAGYISPDLDFLEYMDKRLLTQEQTMYDTIWGTTNVRQENTQQDRTATEVVVDVQPITNKLNETATVVEWVHNFIGLLVSNFTILTKTDKNEKVFHISYGRRFIIESPDVVLQRYQEARAKGDPSVVLDKLLEEFIVSKYKTDPYMQEVLLKKFVLEPYVHWDINTVNSIFGREEALRKVAFEAFWKEKADTTQDVDTIREHLNTYTDEYISSKPAPPVGA